MRVVGKGPIFLSIWYQGKRFEQILQLGESILLYDTHLVTSVVLNFSVFIVNSKI